ncbi:amidohydrolase family protein [Streptomyces sp. MA5143a]|uniref:amidohydrolase family protein n=1 Tax=Streptomyces sp. MA5143a TaxID=2083010 RepID=UPI000D1BF494|nr:amidohydrolase family protein [Streptomyces sp. MA5143a]SPF04107.1 putative metal-dependent hydrolase of the TIM-barrel fold protein [Streptomyces sp. MA5143a]
MTNVDVHQHLWPPSLVAALRSRREPPFMDGWTLFLDGEPPYEVAPAAHDVARRAGLAAEDGLGRALVSLSSPLGVEWLPGEQARPLLDAYHEGVAALPEPFGAWAAACVRDVDAAATAEDLDRGGFAGLQLPADALADAAGYARCAPLLDLLEDRGLPLFVHPGPAGEAGAEGPGWWPAMVPYVQQMHAAWFAFRAFGRPRHPRLRVCFALLAGLAPLHGERFAARGDAGLAGTDARVFVETSSYGPTAVDAVVRALGVDAVVQGSDRPYAEPPLHPGFGLGGAAAYAFRIANPRRLLMGEG